MAAEKRIQIGVGKLKLKLLRATEANVSEENDSEIIKTFDEPVTAPSSDAGYTIDISMLEARSLADYKKLKQILKQLKTTTGTLSIYETVRHKKGDFEVENHFTGVTLKSNKIKYSADSLSARDLSLSAETLREVVAGEEIK